MPRKIIQIIPAPEGMQSVTYDTDDGTLYRSPVDFLSLEEDEDGYRSVSAQHMDAEGYSLPVEGSINFVGIERGTPLHHEFIREAVRGIIEREEKQGRKIAQPSFPI